MTKYLLPIILFALTLPMSAPASLPACTQAQHDRYQATGAN